MMMIMPAIISKSALFLDRNLPAVVAVAPRRINTIENPMIKPMEFKKIFLVFATPLSMFENVSPEMYEIYAGIRGRMHGDTKEIKPAINA